MARRRIKPPDGVKRRKATPDLYPDEGPCDIAEAYDQLSRGAFAAWIRMCVAERDDLRQGREHLAEVLGYSKRQSDELIRELERSGFIATLPEGPWRRTVITIVRRPLLQRGNRFTRFS